MTGGTAGRHGKMSSRQKSECIWGWAFILPTMTGLIILNIYPIFKTITESFYKTGDLERVICLWDLLR